MVVHDLDIVRIAVAPAKADSPLIVDSNAVLAGPIAAKLLEPITGRDSKIVQDLAGVHQQQLPKRRALKPSRPPPNRFP
jgi:hypothetical protein